MLPHPDYKTLVMEHSPLELLTTATIFVITPGNTNLTLHQVRRRAYTSKYVWTDDASGYACDAADVQSCAARYVNNALDEHRNNAKFVLQGTRLSLQATRTILPHEEICAAYGGTGSNHTFLPPCSQAP